MQSVVLESMKDYKAANRDSRKLLLLAKKESGTPHYTGFKN